MILFIVESVNQSFSISLSINNKFLFSLLECLMAVLYSLVIKAFIKISTNSHIIINAQTLNLHRSHLTLHASSLSNSSFKAFLTHSFTYSLREPRIYKASLPNSSRQQNCNHLLFLSLIFFICLLFHFFLLLFLILFLTFSHHSSDKIFILLILIFNCPQLSLFINCQSHQSISCNFPGSFLCVSHLSFLIPSPLLCL